MSVFGRMHTLRTDPEEAWRNKELAFNKPVRIHCKAGSVSVRLVFESRSKCQDIVARYKDDGIPYEIDSPFCCAKTTITVRQSRSLEDREIGKQFVPFCGECCQISSKLSSPMEMTKVHLSSPRSTHDHKSSPLKIEETELENLCSNLPLLEVDSCFLLLHLTCQCVMAAFSPPRLFAAWRVEAPFSAVSMVLHVVLSLTRSVIMYDATSCSREDSLFECGRPCDALSCLFSSALWLQQSQSILVQEIHSPKNIGLTCFKTFPIADATCLHVGPMSLEWPVDPFARFGHSRPFLLFPEVPNDDQQRGALPVSTHSRWRQNTLQAPPQVLQRIAGWNGCGRFLTGGLWCITWNTRGLIGSVFSKEKNRELKLKYLNKLFINNKIVGLQEVHGKDEYLQAIQVLALPFRFFGTFFS